MKKCIIALGLTVFLAGCTDSGKARVTSYGSAFKIEVISGAQVVRTYTSTGKVSPNQMDGILRMQLPTSSWR
jgi:hypothetical protein